MKLKWKLSKAQLDDKADTQSHDGEVQFLVTLVYLDSAPAIVPECRQGFSRR